MVYVTNKSDKDYSAAEKYGELHFMNEGHYNVFNMIALIDFMKTAFEKWQPTKDYLVMSGSPIVCSVAIQFILSKFNQINILVFDAKKREYVIRTLKVQMFK